MPATNSVYQFNGTQWAPVVLAGGGTVSSIATGTGLTGGPITGTGTISIAAGGVTSTELAAGAVANTNLATNAVNSSQIIDGTITDADISGTAAIAVTKLATGTNGQVLTVNAGVPSWQNASGLTNPMTTAGDLIYGGTGGIPTRLGEGLNGQVLASSGTGTLSWITINGGSPNYVPRSTGSGASPPFSSSSIYDNGTNYTGIGRTVPIASGAANSRFEVDAVGFGGGGTYAGMKVNTDAGGSPYYGYSSGGDSNAWTTLDGISGDWKVINGTGTLALTSNGDVKFFRALLPNNTPGISGQVLTSAGPGSPPTWTTISGGGNMITSNNLSDLTNFATARANLALGSVAYTWPAANGTGVLTNNGSGTLTWGSTLTNPMTAPNDMIVGGAAGASTRLAAPGNNQVLTSNGSGAVTWAPQSTFMTNPLTTNGDIIYAVGTTPTRLATASGFLKGGAVPSYSAVGLATADVTGTLPVGSGGTGITTFGTGGLLYASGATTMGTIGNGTAGQMLLVTGTTPTWQSMSGDGAINGVGTFTLSNSAATGSTIVTAINASTGSTLGARVLPTFGTQNVSTTGTLTAGNTTVAQLAVSGPTTTINGATLSWPAANAAGVLTNNGTGTLTWAAGSGWALGGNTGTVDGAIGTGTNYIGTRDNVPLNLIVNNQEAGRIEAAAANANTMLGYQSGNVNTGIQNAGFGYQALLNNTTGERNAAFGHQAMLGNTTGNGNTGIGRNALSANTTGGANTAVGTRALFNNSASNNTAVGNDAMFSNTSAGDNAAFGVLSLSANTGAQNTGLGAYSLQSNTTGTNNAGLGNSVLLLNTTGSQNTAVGSLAGRTNIAANANTTGSANTFIGYAAGPGTSTQLTNATAIGANASVTTSNTIQLGDAAVTTVNVGTGTTAKLVAGQLQITGGTLGAGRVLTSDASGNATWQPGGGSGLITSSGSNTLTAGNSISTAGIDNAIFGNSAGAANTGNYNVIVGQNAALSKTGGDLNTIIGWYAGNAANTAAGNTLVGAQAGENTTGAVNTFIGEKAGQANTTGNQSVYIGNRAGDTNTTGDGQVVIGNNADVGSASLSNAAAIGFRAQVNQSNSLVLGSINGVNGATASTRVGIGTTSPAVTLDIQATDAVNMPDGTTAQRPSTPAAGAMRYNTTENTMEYFNGTNWYFMVPKVALLSDVKGPGLEGGNALSNAWQVRTLNTLVDPGSFVSLNSNQFTLSSGEYIIEGSAPAFAVDSHMIKVFNVSDGADFIYGSAEYVHSSLGYTNSKSTILAHFIIGSTKTFRIEHFTSTTAAINGLGVGTFPIQNIFTQLKITKLR
ncbi:MAG: beta strand repeat-containing protein [Cytophagales bacterium]